MNTQIRTGQSENRLEIQKLKRSRFPGLSMLGFHVLAVALAFAVQPALAKADKKNPGYTLVGQTTLDSVRATDLFLREDKLGHKYLYVVYANDAVDVLKVTNGGEVTKTHRLALGTDNQRPHIEPVDARFVVLANTAASERYLAVVDTKTPATPELAKHFKNADCYTIDPSDDTLYVVHDGKLSILRFDRPVSSDAELFEQMLQNR